MFYTIYQITNLINNKIYIGLHRTQNLDDGYMGSGKYIRRAIDMHGIENFKKEILFVFDNEKDMIDKEVELVTEEFCLREDTYNLAKGGGDGWSYANRNGLNIYGLNGKTPNVKDNFDRAKITQENKRKNDPEWVEQKSQRISLGVKEHIKNNGPTFKNHTHRDETKRKIGLNSSICQKGDKNSQYGKRWIHSISQQISKKISKDDDLPIGWAEGRKIKF